MRLFFQGLGASNGSFPYTFPFELRDDVVTPPPAVDETPDSISMLSVVDD